MSIYGQYAAILPEILERLTDQIQAANLAAKKETGYKLFEHLITRIKTPESMEDKLARKAYPATPYYALKEIRDAIGIRIVCGFLDDIYRTIEVIRQLPQVKICQEKDYISQAKPNGYRSYHLILEVMASEADCLGQVPGTYFVEVQLRTIAQDSWAALEHQMKYKQDIKNPERIERELKRCADELASCDVTMQTIRDLIGEGGN